MPLEGSQLQLRCATLSEHVREAAAKHFVHQGALEEPHFCFGGVDVDVDAVRGNLDEQMDLGAALLDGGDATGL